MRQLILHFFVVNEKGSAKTIKKTVVETTLFGGFEYFLFLYRNFEISVVFSYKERAFRS